MRPYLYRSVDSTSQYNTRSCFLAQPNCQAYNVTIGFWPQGRKSNAVNFYAILLGVAVASKRWVFINHDSYGNAAQRGSPSASNCYAENAYASVSTVSRRLCYPSFNGKCICFLQSRSNNYAKKSSINNWNLNNIVCIGYMQRNASYAD